MKSKIEEAIVALNHYNKRVDQLKEGVDKGAMQHRILLLKILIDQESDELTKGLEASSELPVPDPKVVDTKEKTKTSEETTDVSISVTDEQKQEIAQGKAETVVEDEEQQEKGKEDTKTEEVKEEVKGEEKTELEEVTP